jgi:hypothetical protein
MRDSPGLSMNPIIEWRDHGGHICLWPDREMLILSLYWDSGNLVFEEGAGVALLFTLLMAVIAGLR